MMQSIFDLTGKVAIVTGGYWGIGRSIADGLADFGADLVICARNYEECQKACREIQDQKGVKALPLKCNVQDKDQVENMVEATMKHYGKIDILFNNAGITGAAKPFVEITDENWDDTMNTNLKGVFLCSRAVAKEMMKVKQGKIINIMSGASFHPIRNSADYCSSKAGGFMLTQCMALELIRHNIKVNAICPGLFESHLNAELLERSRNNASKVIPIGRMGEAKDIKGLAVFLASEASDYVVGAAIVIDGGVGLK